VSTVHDLIYARFPDAHSGLRDRGMRLLVPAAVRRSQRVIVDSRSTRADLIELLGASPERIDVAPLGPAPIRGDLASSAPDTRARLQLGERQVLLSLSAKRPAQEPAHADLRARADRPRAPAAAGAPRLPHLA